MTSKSFATCVSLMCSLQLIIGQVVQIGFLGLAVENGFVLFWILLVSYSLDEAARVSMGKKTVGRGLDTIYYMFCAFRTK